MFVSKKTVLPKKRKKISPQFTETSRMPSRHLPCGGSCTASRDLCSRTFRTAPVSCSAAAQHESRSPTRAVGLRNLCFGEHLSFTRTWTHPPVSCCARPKPGPLRSGRSRRVRGFPTHEIGRTITMTSILLLFINYSDF